MKYLQINSKSESESSSILDKIEIAKPCNADWDSMSGDERERHCQLCQLNVFNISDMTRPEAEAFLTDRIPKGRVCVRFFQRHDGTIITDNCPRGLRAARDAARRLRHQIAAAASLVLTFIAPMIALGQNNNGPNKNPVSVKGERMGDVAMPSKAPGTAGNANYAQPQVLRGEPTMKQPPIQMMGGICPAPIGDMSKYMAKVHDKVKLPVDLFKGLSADGKAGTEVQFKIHKDGSISDIKMGTSSGDKAVDDKLIESIKKAAPFGKVSDMEMPNKAVPYEAKFKP